MLDILSYHQVMPSFLDFVFSFGRQEYPEDFHFSGFKQESRLCPMDRGLQIPELNRSGRNIQMCYSLRSVEPTESREEWSIRQTAFYHSFDLESGQATWIVIKGNEKMRDRIMEETLASNGSDLRCFETVEKSFSSALATHILFCEWSAENWRWYINLFEEKVQNITRRALDKEIASHVPADATIAATTPKPDASPPNTLKRAGTFVGTFARALTWDRSNNRRLPEKAPSVVIARPNCNDKFVPSVLPPGLTEQNVATSAQTDPEEFSLYEVRRIQLIEERANETLLVLKTNTNVQQQLKAYYCSLPTTEGFPHDVKLRSEKDLAYFEVRINSLQDYFRMQQARLETLLRLLADRKTLLYGILDYQNMQASQKLAAKGQDSANSMEKMTRQMHEIAVRTKKETVSMKIITLVTLFFLPGTFISVSQHSHETARNILIIKQTLMSTDIIRYKTTAPAAKDGMLFSWPALHLFLAITIPAMILTFIAWGGIYWMAKRLETRKAKRQEQDQDLEYNAGLASSNEKIHALSEVELKSQAQAGLLSNSQGSGSIQPPKVQWKTWFSRIHLV
jgi:Mg2+ and Co2+ transporter CorA